MKKCLSILLVLVTVCFILVGCGDDSYAGLHITDNEHQILELCKQDTTFTTEEAHKIASLLAKADFKKIKKVKEFEGGTEKKIMIKDANDKTFIIFISNNKVCNVNSEEGNSIYIRTIEKNK